MPTTPDGLVYPDGTALTDIPGDIQALAEDVDGKYVLHLVGTLAARPAPSRIGRVYRATDDDSLYYDTGAAWIRYLPETVVSGTYLLLAGGTLTGTLGIKAVSEATEIVAAAGAAEEINATTAGVWDVTLDANVTFTFAGAPTSGRTGTITLILRQDATPRTITWPASVDWPDATAPDLSVASAVYVMTFLTLDAGTTWLGLLGGGEFG